MKILVVGGGGFIGRHVAAELCRRGHEVVITRRRPRERLPGPCPAGEIAADYARLNTPSQWTGMLDGMTCVINAAGILRESPGNDFETTHHRGPCALFQACRTADVGRVIQVSALGADETAATPYHRTKRAADDCLRGLDLDWVILQPSVVYGSDSGSGRMFNRLASLPVAAVPGKGEQAMQPVHVDDLAEVVANLAEDPAVRHETIAAVGPRPVTYAGLLRALRKSMGKPPARLIGIPMPVMRAMAGIAALSPTSPLTPDTLQMLEQGSTADPARFAEILGWAPRAPEEFETL